MFEIFPFLLLQDSYDSLGVHLSLRIRIFCCEWYLFWKKKYSFWKKFFSFKHKSFFL